MDKVNWCYIVRKLRSSFNLLSSHSYTQSNLQTKLKCKIFPLDLHIKDNKMIQLCIKNLVVWYKQNMPMRICSEALAQKRDQQNVYFDTQCTAKVCASDETSCSVICTTVDVFFTTTLVKPFAIICC